MKILIILTSIILSFLNYSFADLPIRSPEIKIKGKIVNWMYRNGVEYTIESESGSDIDAVTVTTGSHYLLLIEENNLNLDIINETNLFTKAMRFFDKFIIRSLDENEKHKNYLLIPLFVDKNFDKIRIGNEIIIPSYCIQLDGANISTPFKEYSVREVSSNSYNTKETQSIKN